MVFKLFAILQMYEFSSKSQLVIMYTMSVACCLRYCKCTSFQANHNWNFNGVHFYPAVCDTANVRVFKQITTPILAIIQECWLFAILQMYEFSSKSQLTLNYLLNMRAVCDTANVRVFKQITTPTTSVGR